MLAIEDLPFTSPRMNNTKHKRINHSSLATVPRGPADRVPIIPLLPAPSAMASLLSLLSLRIRSATLHEMLPSLGQLNTIRSSYNFPSWINRMILHPQGSFCTLHHGLKSSRFCIKFFSIHILLLSISQKRDAEVKPSTQEPEPRTALFR